MAEDEEKWKVAAIALQVLVTQAFGINLAFTMCLLQCQHCTDEAYIGRHSTPSVCREVKYRYIYIYSIKINIKTGDQSRYCCIISSFSVFQVAFVLSGLWVSAAFAGKLGSFMRVKDHAQAG